MLRHRAYPEFKDRDRMFICIFILNYMLNAVFLMTFSLRYFMVTLMFSTILIAIFIGSNRMKNWLRIGLVSIIVITNALYISCNYIYSFRQSGGRTSVFWAGNFFENSSHFADTSVLYNYLKDKNIQYIWVPEGFIRWPLIFLDLNLKRLNIKAKKESISTKSVYFISYKGEIPKQYGLGSDYSVSQKVTHLDNYEIFLMQKEE